MLHKNIYVQNVKVNGKSQTKNTLTHEQLMNGGTIEFDMGSEPNKEWGSGEEDVPTSLTKDKNQKVKSATLLYIKDHQITKEYKGLKQLKDHSDEILQMSW